MTKIINSFDARKLSLKSELAKMQGHAVVQVSPELAKAWLKLHTANRPLSMTKTKWYAEQMQKGEWKLSGQGLIFSDIGNGLDGQHRLKAIVLSGCTIEIDVRFGIPEDVFAVLDSGPQRTAADSLAIAGITNYTTCAAITRNVMGFERYGSSTSFQGSKRPTNTSVLDYVLSNPEIEGFAGHAQKYFTLSGGLLPASIIGTVHYLASKVNADSADKFIYMLCTGAGITPTDVIFKLRTKLMHAKLDKQRSLNKKATFALIIKAWRYFCKGKQVKVLKYDAEREQFPSFYLP